MLHGPWIMDHGPIEGGLTPSKPRKTGSAINFTPNLSKTRERISEARRKISAALAPPLLTRARVCLVERPAGPTEYPLENPACSISHAAAVFTLPGVAGERGT